MLISQFSLNIFVPISAHELDFSNVCITSRCKMRKIILSLFAQSTTFSYKAFIIIIQIYTECVSTILTINQSLSNRASQMEGNNVFPIKISLTNSLVFCMNIYLPFSIKWKITVELFSWTIEFEKNTAWYYHSYADFIHV